MLSPHELGRERGDAPVQPGPFQTHIVAAPAFAIRKPAVAVFTLDDYVASPIMSAAQAQTLRAAVAARSNILVAGGTSTGMTTLTNALLAEAVNLSCPRQIAKSSWDLIPRHIDVGKLPTYVASRRHHQEREPMIQRPAGPARPHFEAIQRFVCLSLFALGASLLFHRGAQPGVLQEISEAQISFDLSNAKALRSLEEAVAQLRPARLELR